MILLILNSFGSWLVYYGLRSGLGLSTAAAAWLVSGAFAAFFHKDLLIQRKLPCWATLLLFLMLAVNASLLHSRLIDDHTAVISYALFALIGFGSLALRRPFTLQYARQGVPREKWAHPVFLRINYILTSVWSLIFLANVAINLLPDGGRGAASGRSLSYTISIIGVLLTAEFPDWYRKRVKARAPA